MVDLKTTLALPKVLGELLLRESRLLIHKNDNCFTTHIE